MTDYGQFAHLFRTLDDLAKMNAIARIKDINFFDGSRWDDFEKIYIETDNHLKKRIEDSRCR
jgi:hypothetical protein